MKKHLLLAVLCLIITESYGQKKRRSKRKKEKIERSFDEYSKYRGIILGIGPRFLSATTGTITTNYIDDSPAPDVLVSSTVIEDSYTSIGVQIGYKFGRYNGLSHKIVLDASLADNGGGLIAGYDIGWNFSTYVSDKQLLIRPSIFLGGGSYGFKIGELENNTGFIQIGEKMYFDDFLDVKLDSDFFLYSPSIEVVYKVADKIDVYLTANYDIASDNKDPMVIFTSPADDTGSTFSLIGDNPDIKYEGEKLESLPYDASGIRLSIGASYLWNRD